MLMRNISQRLGAQLTDLLYVRDYWVVIPSVIIGLFLSFFITYPGSQTYKELTAGSITWIDESKSQDYFSIIIFFLGTLLTLTLLNNMVRKLRRDEAVGACLYSKTRDALLLSSTPLLFYVVNAWSYSAPVRFGWLVLATIFILASLAPFAKWYKSDLRVLNDNYSDIVSSTCIVVVSSFFTTAGLYLAGLRYKAFIDSEMSMEGIRFLASSVGIASLIAMVVVFFASKKIDILTLRIKYLSVLAQAGIPFLFLLMIPAPWVGVDLDSYSITPKPELFVFTGMLVLASFSLLIYQLLNVRNNNYE